MQLDEFKSLIEIKLCVPPISGDFPTTGNTTFLNWRR